MRNPFLLCIALLWMTTATFAQIGINTDNSAPDPSAMLDVKSTDKGALLPRMTFDQRNAIASPAEGLMVVCTNCGINGSGVLCLYTNGKWTPINPCFTPAPVAGTHIPSQQQIVWNWNAVAGAAGYKWNTTNNFTTAMDMGVATSKTETGLTCETEYTRYAWAYFDCGASLPYPLTQSTLGCWICGQPVTDSRDGKIYNTVVIGNQCWMKENLNTGTFITSFDQQLNNNIVEKYCFSDDINQCSVYGGLYQWNELMNYTASSNTNPSGRQGICPANWHIPSNAEWDQVVTYLGGDMVAGGAMKEDGMAHWATPNSYATNASGFTALPSGGLDISLGFFDLTFQGYFWTSTAVAEGLSLNARCRVMYFSGADVTSMDYDKFFGYPIRCVKD